MTTVVGTPGTDQPKAAVSQSGLLPPGVGCSVKPIPAQMKEAPSVTTIAGILRSWMMAPSAA